MIAACLTEVAGASDIVDRGFVTYSNAAKVEMLGVCDSLIRREGAVSEAVARAMAEGALRHSAATMTIAVTGIAGPGGGSPDKPVGLVHLASAGTGQATLHCRRVFQGDRTAIRTATLAAALIMLQERLDS